MAELLKNVNYEVVYISELPRARQTAEVVNKYHGREFIVDSLINDNRTGFEGEPVEDFLLR